MDALLLLRRGRFETGKMMTMALLLMLMMLWIIGNAMAVMSFVSSL